MLSDHISFKSSVIHFHYVQNGSRLVICFHGYDESGGSFAVFPELLGADTSLLAIDLPFHGATDWREPGPLTASVLWEIIDRIRTLHFPGSGRIWLTGFSLGGRISLGLVASRPQQVAQLILMAPDGLKVNAWYWLATRTLAGRWLFRRSIRHPGWFFSLLQIGHKSALLNPGVYTFTKHYLSTETLREQLFKRWMSLRLIAADTDRVRDTIRKHNIPVLLIYGAFDRIMPAATATRFCKSLSNLCRLETIECGHQILHHKNRKSLQVILRAVTTP